MEDEDFQVQSDTHHSLYISVYIFIYLKCNLKIRQKSPAVFGHLLKRRFLEVADQFYLANARRSDTGKLKTLELRSFSVCV